MDNKDKITSHSSDSIDEILPNRSDNKGEIILYQPDNSLKLEVRVENETVWLTQTQIADLFGTKRPAVTKHLNNIYKTGELEENITCSILEHMGNDGKQIYRTKYYYNLDVIISIGYRINSINATLFRIWATKILKNYLLHGYVINQRFEYLEHRVTETEKKIDFFVKTSLPPVEGIFFDGQIFDSNLIKSAKRSVTLIDNYADESVLLLLSKRGKNVDATIYTASVSPQFQLDLRKHNAQYPAVTVKTFTRSHDRFIFIDDDVYHLGASLKDLGKKWFAFSKMRLNANMLLQQII